MAEKWPDDRIISWLCSNVVLVSLPGSGVLLLADHRSRGWMWTVG